MNPEIKRLLKLSSIPGFKLNAREQLILDAWKNMQEAVVVKPPKKTRSKGSKTRSKASQGSETIDIPSQARSASVRVQNVITSEDLTLNSES